MLKKYWKMMAVALFFLLAGAGYRSSLMSGDRIVLEGTGAAKDAENAGGESPESGAGFYDDKGPDGKAGLAGADETAAGNGMEEQGARGVLENGAGAGDTRAGNEPGYFIHICGQVKSPGVYELPEGSRVFEAVEAAGGFTEQAAGEFLNLAEKVTDGMKLVVYSKEEAEAMRAAGITGSGSQSGGNSGEEAGPVNINTAGKEALMTLSGIGESRAEDIIRYREESGGFKKIEDIMKVPGIKDAAFQKIKDRIIV